MTKACWCSLWVWHRLRSWLSTPQFPHRRRFSSTCLNYKGTRCELWLEPHAFVAVNVLSTGRPRRLLTRNGSRTPYISGSNAPESFLQCGSKYVDVNRFCCLTQLRIVCAHGIYLRTRKNCIHSTSRAIRTINHEALFLMFFVRCFQSKVGNVSNSICK